MDMLLLGVIITLEKFSTILVRETFSLNVMCNIFLVMRGFSQLVVLVYYKSVKSVCMKLVSVSIYSPLEVT